jgi:hypothetical protein
MSWKKLRIFVRFLFFFVSIHLSTFEYALRWDFFFTCFFRFFDLSAFYINEREKSIYKIIIRRNSNKKRRKKKKTKNEIFYAKIRMSFSPKKMPRDFSYWKGFLRLVYTNQSVEEKKNNQIQLSLDDQLDRWKNFFFKRKCLRKRKKILLMSSK